MYKKLRNYLGIPGEIQRDYWREVLKKNDLALRVICVIIFGVELYNIVRVLFLSSSGLSTRNNRIYFGFYSVLLLLAALWMVLRPVRHRASWRVQWGVQYSMIVLLILWHISLNVYDLQTQPDGDVTVYVTAILALGVFVRMPAVFSLPCIGVGYGLFLFASMPNLSSGCMVNLTITTIVALGISFTNSHHTVNDLTQHKELQEMNARLQELAYLDPLTGLLNTGALKLWADQCLENAAETGGVTLFIIDMDNFKQINDTYGHPCGDEVLKETALRMRHVFQENGRLGRIGGDEFAAALPKAMDEAGAKMLGERLIQAVSEIRLEDNLIGVNCSVGACWSTQPGLRYVQIYREADQALYQAKREGKGRCCVRRIDP